MLFAVSAIAASAGVWTLTEPRPRQQRRRIPWGNDDLIWFGSFGAAALAVSLSRPQLVLVMFPLAMVLAMVVRAQQRKRAQEQRRNAISSELPVVVELMALAVSAGESPTSAISRVAQVSHGELGRSLQRTMEAISDGTTLVRALEFLKADCQHYQVDRFVDSVILGYERGTSLNDVLHAQALDTRESFRRSLIEHSARAEIRMMVPIVFLIMPVTILFALFPSLYALTQAQ